MFENLHHLLPKALKTLNLEHKTQAAHASFITRNFLQEHFPQNITPTPYKVISYKNQVLKIYCSHPVVAHEIQQLSKPLIAVIKSKNPTIKVKKIQTTTQFPQSENIN